MSKTINNTWGRRGAWSVSTGNMIAANAAATSISADTFHPLCEICGKPRNKKSPHTRCSRIRQKKYAKDNK